MNTIEIYGLNELAKRLDVYQGNLIAFIGRHPNLPAPDFRAGNRGFYKKSTMMEFISIYNKEHRSLQRKPKNNC